MRRPGIRRPASTAQSPPRASNSLARSKARRKRKALAALNSVGRPTRAKISRPTSAPAMVARMTAGTKTVGSTAPLAIAIPPMIRSRSPGAKGTGTPASSMNRRPAMITTSRSPLRCWMEGSDGTGRLGQQLTDEGEGKVSAAQECVVEGLEGEARALFQVAAQFVDQQLAQRVIQIKRIPGAAARLPRGRKLGMESGLLEEANGLCHGHALAMQPQRAKETAVAQQRVHQLGQLEPRRPAVAGFDHHLLHVVGPTLSRALYPHYPSGAR